MNPEPDQVESNRRGTGRRPCRCNRFTLVELMLALTVVSLLMLMLFRFLASAQMAWTLSESTSRIYENSRVAFDLLEQDVQALVTSTESGFTIGVYTGNPNPADSTDCLYTCFIASTEPHDSATSRLCEISYKHHTDPSASSTQYNLQRQITCDNDTNNWGDFLGQLSAWYLNNTIGGNYQQFEKVVGGVDSFNITYYDGSGNAFAASSDMSTMPARAVVDLTLFDETKKHADPEERFKTQRTFTKIFYLSHLQQ